MIRLTTELNDIIVAAKDSAEKSKAEFLLPEHVFMELSENSKFERIFKEVGGDIDIFRAEIKEILDEVDTSSSLEVSPTLAELLNFAVLDAKGRGIAETDVASFLNASIHYKDSNMLDLLDSQGVDDEEFMLRYLDESPSADDGDYDESWHELVKDFNKIAAAKKEPLIGREKEIDDTIRILCRKEKSNPLHVGEPGVGKTAITLGLAKRINEGKVPAKLKDKKIYEVEMSSLLAGARYKGDFEERLKTVLDGAAHEKNAILYIDEIHTVIGAGTPWSTLEPML